MKKLDMFLHRVQKSWNFMLFLQGPRRIGYRKEVRGKLGFALKWREQEVGLAILLCEVVREKTMKITCNDILNQQPTCQFYAAAYFCKTCLD